MSPVLVIIVVITAKVGVLPGKMVNYFSAGCSLMKPGSEKSWECWSVVGEVPVGHGGEKSVEGLCLCELVALLCCSPGKQALPQACYDSTEKWQLQSGEWSHPVCLTRGQMSLPLSEEIIVHWPNYLNHWQLRMKAFFSPLTAQSEKQEVKTLLAEGAVTPLPSNEWPWGQ